MDHNPSSAQDSILADALKGYYRQLLNSNKRISELLSADYDITMSAAMVKRHQKELGLLSSGPNTRSLLLKETEQLHMIAYHSGQHITQDVVEDIMLLIGIHERWAGDGHDKLYEISFPVWAVVDDATGRWLDAYVVLNNQLGEVIGYLFLCLVEKYKGIPLQFSTDCGSETTQLYGLINALCVHNISIEWQWLRLRMDWGNMVILDFNKGITDGLYNSQNPQQYKLLLKEDLGGKQLVAFTSEAFSEKAQKVYDDLNIHELTSRNVWHIFQVMYDVLFP
ncbi:hypothetical protein L208DRAFT_1423694 [Tricholoma matsutake]|nr:hypothetical protein L208DRAFT_1423694 [Tricholoma matsutake 945]